MDATANHPAIEFNIAMNDGAVNDGAVNYGGWIEMTRACCHRAEQVQQEKLKPVNITDRITPWHYTLDSSVFRPML